jgi:DNA protecting protein DprA
MAARLVETRLSDEERFDWLRLIRSENVGPRTFRALLDRCGGAAAALAALPDLARRGGASRPIRVAGVDEIEREIEESLRLGVRFIAYCEPDYSPALRHIDAAPPLLALRGREEALQQPSVAIVGSRNASAAGLAFADRLARGLGQAGYVVVSGLARGIDQRAHVAALETGTVAVLAGGHAKPYPPEAEPLLPRIAKNGAIVSEMPLAWEPRGRDFPRRNRIVSGLALGVIIVEAARGSGSLITAASPPSRGARCSPHRVPRSIRAPKEPTTCCATARPCARASKTRSTRSSRCGRALPSDAWRSRAPATICGSTSRPTPTNPPRPNGTIPAKRPSARASPPCSALPRCRSTNSRARRAPTYVRSAPPWSNSNSPDGSSTAAAIASR